MALPTPPTWSLGSTGAVVPTQQQLLTYFQQVFLVLYGVDLTTQDISSPDNQFLNIIVQAFLDNQDYVLQVLNSFDPDQATGVILAQRAAINGIQPENGTNSTTDVTIGITVTNPATVTLYGLDQTTQQVFTVQDLAGNQWQLITTQTALATGNYIFAFQAANIGAVIAIPGTITIQSTIVVGVSSVNNAASQTFIGAPQESDAAFKIRRQQSTSISSQGFLDGLIAALENIKGVTFATVIENITSTTFDGTGNYPNIPANAGLGAHSIWAIVAAQNESTTAMRELVAQAIYAKRNAGAGMRGVQVFNIVRPNGTTVQISWDWVIDVPIFLVFNALSVDGINLPKVNTILNGSVVNGNIVIPSLGASTNVPTGYLFNPTVAQTLTGNMVSTDVQDIDSNTFINSVGFSNGIYQILYFSDIAASGSFKLSYNGTSTPTIQWNDTAATIQGFLRAISGLGSVVVTGSIANQNIMIWMDQVTNIQLIGINSNTLLNSGSDPVEISPLNDTSNFIQTIYLNRIPASGQFKLTYKGNSTSLINWNDSIATIQSDLRGLSGLSSVTVSGSLASQEIAIAMLAVSNPSSIMLTDSSLLDDGSLAIVASSSQNFPFVLPVTSSLQQYNLASINTIILSQPGFIFLTAPSAVYSFQNGIVQWPANLSVAAGETVTFIGYGGYGTLIYSCSTGIIDPSTGVYTAPGSGSDTVVVTDVLGNIANILVTVT